MNEYEKILSTCRNMFLVRGYEITEDGFSEEEGWFLKGIANKSPIFLYIIKKYTF